MACGDWAALELGQRWCKGLMEKESIKGLEKKSEELRTLVVLIAVKN